MQGAVSVAWAQERGVGAVAKCGEGEAAIRDPIGPFALVRSYFPTLSIPFLVLLRETLALLSSSTTLPIQLYDSKIPGTG